MGVLVPLLFILLSGCASQDSCDISDLPSSIIGTTFIESWRRATTTAAFWICRRLGSSSIKAAELVIQAGQPAISLRADLIIGAGIALTKPIRRRGDETTF